MQGSVCVPISYLLLFWTEWEFHHVLNNAALISLDLEIPMHLQLFELWQSVLGQPLRMWDCNCFTQPSRNLLILPHSSICKSFLKCPTWYRYTICTPLTLQLADLSLEGSEVLIHIVLTLGSNHISRGWGLGAITYNKICQITCRSTRQRILGSLLCLCSLFVFSQREAAIS